MNTKAQTAAAPAQSSNDLRVLRIGERDSRKDPAQRNGTLSTLVCGGPGRLFEFPAKCYEGWTVSIGRRTVTGTYAEVVAEIRQYVIRRDPTALARTLEQQAEAARILARFAAEAAARETEAVAAVDHARAAAGRASAAAHRVDLAYADRIASEDGADYAHHHATEAARCATECVRLNSRRAAYWTDDVLRTAKRAEEAAAECERVARHYGLPVEAAA